MGRVRNDLVKGGAGENRPPPGGREDMLENVFLSIKWIRPQSGFGSLGDFFPDPSTKSPLRLRLFVQIVIDAGKCGISAAPYCHLKMSSRKDRPVYHRGYKRNRDLHEVWSDGVVSKFSNR